MYTEKLIQDLLCVKSRYPKVCFREKRYDELSNFKCKDRSVIIKLHHPCKQNDHVNKSGRAHTKRLLIPTSSWLTLFYFKSLT